MKKSLSKNEIVFCRLKVEGKTDLQAAKEAGYVEEYGKNLLKKVKIIHLKIELLLLKPNVKLSKRLYQP